MAARRGHGEASVYKEAGRWRGLVDLGRDGTGRRRRKKVTGATRAEVLEKIRAIQRDLSAGSAPKSDRLTLNAFLDHWTAVTLPGTIADSTLDNYLDTLRLHIRPALGDHVLARLAVRDVEALFAAKRAAGYSPNSLRLMRTILRRALNAAEREGLVSRNVAALSTPPRLRRTPGRSLTPDQARRLLDALRGHRLEVMYLLTIAFGLRRGEALGLLWEGFDAAAATMHVTHGVKRVKTRDAEGARHTQLTLGELKTIRAHRTLYLTPPLVDALIAHRARQQAERDEAGFDWPETGLVFVSEAGTMLDPDNVSRRFVKIAERAGIGHWHLHELRHTGASLMLAGGTPLHVVSEVLGHASIAVTKDVYGHLVQGEKRTAAEAMTSMLLDHPPEAGSMQGQHSPPA